MIHHKWSVYIRSLNHETQKQSWKIVHSRGWRGPVSSGHGRREATVNYSWLTEQSPSKIQASSNRTNPVRGGVGRASQSQSCKHGRHNPISHLSSTTVDEGVKPFSYPSTPEAGGRAGHVVINVEDPTPTPSSYNTWGSKPCTSPEQHNRVNPVTTGINEPAPKL